MNAMTSTVHLAPPRLRPALDREVHKLNRRARLVQGWQALGTDTFIVRATPDPALAHPHYQQYVPPAGQLAMRAETFRQAVLLIAHAWYAVPRDSAFVMRSLQITEAPDPLRRISGPVDLMVSCSQIRRNREHLRGMDIEITFMADGDVVARGVGELTILTQALYQRARNGQGELHHRSASSPLSPGAVGVASASDVLIARPDSCGLQMVVDTAHPWWFDHAADHVPGMVFVEAALQAHHLFAPDSRPVTAAAAFTRYAELRPVIDITATPGPRGGQVITFTQCGHEVASVGVVGA